MSEGVIEFCGMEVVSSSCHMPEANPGSQIIDQFLVFSGLKSSQSPAGSGKARVVRAPE